MRTSWYTTPSSLAAKGESQPACFWREQDGNHPCLHMKSVLFNAEMYNTEICTQLLSQTFQIITTALSLLQINRSLYKFNQMFQASPLPNKTGLLPHTGRTNLFQQKPTLKSTWSSLNNCYSLIFQLQITQHLYFHTFLNTKYNYGKIIMCCNRKSKQSTLEQHLWSIHYTALHMNVCNWSCQYFRSNGYSKICLTL